MTHREDRFQEVLRRAREAGSNTSREILEPIRGRLLARIRLMMGEEARARMESGDVLQQVLVEFLATCPLEDIQSEEHLLRWLARTARNFILHSIRKKREGELTSLLVDSGILRADDAANPANAARHREAIDDLADAIGNLSEDAQRVIELRHFEFLSFREIGDRLQRTGNAVQLLHTRALTELGRALRGRL